MKPRIALFRGTWCWKLGNVYYPIAPWQWRGRMPDWRS